MDLAAYAKHPTESIGSEGVLSTGSHVWLIGPLFAYCYVDSFPE